jgi:hypothetical protein
MGLLNKIQQENSTNSSNINLFNDCKKIITKHSKLRQNYSQIEKLLANYTHENSIEANRLITHLFEIEHKIPMLKNNQYSLVPTNKSLNLYNHIVLENNLLEINSKVKKLFLDYNYRKNLTGNKKPNHLYYIGLTFLLIMTIIIMVSWWNYEWQTVSYYKDYWGNVRSSKHYKSLSAAFSKIGLFILFGISCGLTYLTGIISSEHYSKTKDFNEFNRINEKINSEENIISKLIAKSQAKSKAAPENSFAEDIPIKVNELKILSELKRIGFDENGAKDVLDGLISLNEEEEFLPKFINEISKMDKDEALAKLIKKLKNN